MNAWRGLDIRLLGRFSVRRDGQEIPPSELGGRLGRLLIRILVTRRGTVVPVDVLVDALWPDRGPADPAANVAVLLSRVRRALGKPGLLAAATGGYLLTADDSCVVDAEIFLGHAQSGRAHLDRGRPPAALREFLAAFDTWRGEPLLEDTYADWSQEYRERFQRVYVQVLEGGAQAALQLGHAPIAETLAARAIAREPLRETGYLLLMRALAASGNQAAALASFDTLKAVLAQDLGVEPSGEAVELRRRVAVGGLVPVAPTRPRSLRALLADQGTAGLPFVGRRQELEVIEEMYTRLDCTLVVVTGGAGVGKSRLLAEAAARTRLPLLAARGFLPDRGEAWGVARALLREALSVDPDGVRSIPGPAARALADLVPEIAELWPIDEVVIDSESRRALVIEGGARLISASLGEDGVILIDDFQWTDESTLELVQQVMGRRRRLHVVVAYRPEEMTGDRAAGAFVAALEGIAMVRSIALGKLTREEIAELVDDETLVRAIEEETDRTPLAVAEVLRLLAGEGLVLPGPHGRFRAVSAGAGERSRAAARAGQREAIRRRVDRLPPGARQVLRLLAVLGGGVSASLLARAVGVGQRRVLEALDVLSRTDLALAGGEGWAVSHDLVGEAVIEALRPAERARLHGLAVRALSLEGAEPGTIAAHQLLAGDREAAAVSYAGAARSSLQRFAHSDAGRLAEEGLALEPAREPRSELLAVRAEVRARSGDLAGARDDLRALLTLKEPGPGRSRVLTRMAMLASGSEDYAVADDLVELALAEAGRDDRAKAEALTTGAIVVMNLNDLPQAEARFEEALRLFQRLGDARGAAVILDGRAMALWAGGRIREAAEAMDHVASSSSMPGSSSGSAFRGRRERRCFTGWRSPERGCTTPTRRSASNVHWATWTANATRYAAAAGPCSASGGWPRLSPMALRPSTSRCDCITASGSPTRTGPWDRRSW